MRIKPFRGLRPRPDLAARIPSLPYDVVDAVEARRLAGDDPYSFLHVVRAEIDLDPGIDPHHESVYAKARENLHTMVSRGWLIQDAAASFYVYRLARDGHTQTGLVGVASIHDYLEGRIKRHELTRPDKEDDRVRHTQAIAAQPGMVFLTHRAAPDLEAEIAAATRGPAAVDFVAPDGVGHALWKVDEPKARSKLEGLLARLPAAYIADGHHRAAAYARAGLAPYVALPSSPHDPGRAFMLIGLFPAAHLRVLDYNRLIRDLHGLTPEAFRDRLRDSGFELRDGHQGRRPPHPGTFGMYLAGRWSLLVAPPLPPPIPPSEPISADPVDALDVSVLARLVLGPILGIGDARTDSRIAFAGGIRGMEELETRVDSGEHAVAFALHPTRIEDVLDVADAGREMPPKSTWFEPKLRSGMVVHVLDPRSLPQVGAASALSRESGPR